MASIDSSAPETTSSDNSPTLVRRPFPKHQGPGSDCGSSGDSDSLGSSSSGEKSNRMKNRENERYSENIVDYGKISLSSHNISSQMKCLCSTET